MREIKFRAWDKKENKWLSFDEGDPIGDDGTLSEAGYWCFIFDFEENRVALMQYTGLKDKNGKEIYEGDIVAYLVEGNIEKFEVKWNDNGCWSFGRVWTCNINASEYEVIGNIYENPELLK